MPPPLIKAFGVLKKAAARVNKLYGQSLSRGRGDGRRPVPRRWSSSFMPALYIMCGTGLDPKVADAIETAADDVSNIQTVESNSRRPVQEMAELTTLLPVPVALVCRSSLAS
jgi:hypothetical protein